MARGETPVLELRNVVRSYPQGRTRLEVLRGANLAVLKGEAVGLLGPSGSGKSTLLHIAGLLERPDGGRVLLRGKDCASLSDGQRTRIRREDLGFVYQFHHLLPEFSALENVTLPRLIGGHDRRRSQREAERLLSDLGLSGRLAHRPMELSGGEQQRVAIARALANGPGILLADEPTGNLDPTTADSVFDSLLHLAHDQGLAAVVATHNINLADRFDRLVHLENGEIVEA